MPEHQMVLNCIKQSILYGLTY